MSALIAPQIRSNNPRKSKWLKHPIRLLLISLSLWASQSLAADLLIQISDHKDRPLQNAVVSLSIEGSAVIAAAAKDVTRIDQIKKEFVPFVSAVTTGSTVHFPNHDNIRHQIYSFSAGNQFEIPLYQGRTAKNIQLNTPGIVVLGCNIHDWMQAYIYVSNAQQHAITDSKGHIRFNGLEEGFATVRVWHPHMRGEIYEERIELSEGGLFSHSLETKRVWKKKRPPRWQRGADDIGGGGY